MTHLQLPSRLATLAACVLISTALATAQKSNKALQERPVPFRPGEVLTYDVLWSGGVTAGEVTLSVRGKRPSHNSMAYDLVAEGKSTGFVASLYPVYYKMDSLLDAYTLASQRGSLYSGEGRRSRTAVTLFNQATHTAECEVHTSTVVKTRLTIPPATLDALSVLYVLRAQPLRAGARITVPVVNNASQYQVQLTVEGRDNLATGLGTLAAWRIHAVVNNDAGEPVWRDLALWISDDARRLPLKLQAAVAVGTFDLVIRQVKM